MYNEWWYAKPCVQWHTTLLCIQWYTKPIIPNNGTVSLVAHETIYTEQGGPCQYSEHFSALHRSLCVRRLLASFGTHKLMKSSMMSNNFAKEIVHGFGRAPGTLAAAFYFLLLLENSYYTQVACIGLRVKDGRRSLAAFWQFQRGDALLSPLVPSYMGIVWNSSIPACFFHV